MSTSPAEPPRRSALLDRSFMWPSRLSYARTTSSALGGGSGADGSSFTCFACTHGVTYN